MASRIKLRPVHFRSFMPLSFFLCPGLSNTANTVNTALTALSAAMQSDAKDSGDASRHDGTSTRAKRGHRWMPRMPSGQPGPAPPNRPFPQLQLRPQRGDGTSVPLADGLNDGKERWNRLYKGRRRFLFAQNYFSPLQLHHEHSVFASRAPIVLYVLYLPSQTPYQQCSQRHIHVSGAGSMVWRSSARLAPAPISFTTMNMSLFFRGIHHDDVFGVAIGSIRRHTQISGRRPLSPLLVSPFSRFSSPFSPAAPLKGAGCPCRRFDSLPFSAFLR